MKENQSYSHSEAPKSENQIQEKTQISAETTSKLNEMKKELVPISYENKEYCDIKYYPNANLYMRISANGTRTWNMYLWDTTNLLYDPKHENLLVNLDKNTVMGNIRQIVVSCKNPNTISQTQIDNIIFQAQVVFQNLEYLKKKALNEWNDDKNRNQNVFYDDQIVPFFEKLVNDKQNKAPLSESIV